MKRFLYLLPALALAGCSRANLDYTKNCAAETWRSVGYEIIGYEGYQWGADFGGGLFGYGGAYVWYSLRRHPNDNGIIYTGALQRWGDECHVYGPKAVDALKPAR